MTPDSRRQVQESWRNAVPVADAVARLFYGRLEETAPRLGGAVAVLDPERRRHRLAHALGAVVMGLGRSEPRAEAAEACPDERVVAEALLWALEGVLGPRLGPAARAAWAEALAAHAPEVARAALGVGEEPPQAHAVLGRRLVPAGS